MSLFVKFWGVRGSIPVPGITTRRYGGNTACVEVRSARSRFVLDAGTGIRELGIAMAAEAGPQRVHLLISHAHWDHIQGFPFFSPAYEARSQIHVYGVEPGDDRMHRLLSGQMHSSYFPVQFSDLAGAIVAADLSGGQCTIDDVDVRALPVFHPGGCLSFRLSQGTSSVVYATDNELDQVLVNPELAAGTSGGPLRRLPDALVDFAAGASLLIADGQYTDLGYTNHRGWGHSRATTAVDFAVQAGVPKLAIFHHDPMQTDAEVEEKIDACRQRVVELDAQLEVFAAREGVELRLD